MHYSLSKTRWSKVFEILNWSGSRNKMWHPRVVQGNCFHFVVWKRAAPGPIPALMGEEITVLCSDQGTSKCEFRLTISELLKMFRELRIIAMRWIIWSKLWSGVCFFSYAVQRTVHFHQLVLVELPLAVLQPLQVLRAKIEMSVLGHTVDFASLTFYESLEKS